MTTNILAIPLVNANVETGTNEDWFDSIVYLIDQTDPQQQLDLRGISFELEVRRAAPDHEVILSATTEDLRITTAPPPDYGYLIINVPMTEMLTKFPGNYVGDIRAVADGHYRVTVQFTMTIFEGITR
jgi:hypothetical protein